MTSPTGGTGPRPASAAPLAPGLSEMPPAPPQGNLRAHVAGVLSAAIIAGELPPGTLLTVPTLAAHFAVSATPVREAMLDLQQRDFVAPVRNKGFRVTDVSPEALREIVEVRLLLEPPAMAALAARLDPAALADLRAEAEAIVSAADQGDLRHYLRADQVFHLHLTDLLGNRVLSELVADLRSRTRLVGLVGLRDTEELRISSAEHLDLLDHLAARRAEAASALMERHIRHTLGWWSGTSKARSGM